MPSYNQEREDFLKLIVMPAILIATQDSFNTKIVDVDAGLDCARKLYDIVKPSPERGSEDGRKDGTLYTYYQLELKNINEEWGFTICESLEDVLNQLKYLDIHLDDDTETSDGEPRAVIITGVGMTPEAYRQWKEENLTN